MRPGEETRSHFVEGVPLVPSTTDPCRAPEGVHWVHAFRQDRGFADPLLVGKWLIRVSCEGAAYCWERVRRGTEEGMLGIAAKISTDWGKRNDPAGWIAEGGSGWAAHVVCVYTRDWHDREDVRGVGSRLGELDAVRTQTIHYKPDAFTYSGIWAGNRPGKTALFSMKPPYLELVEHPDVVAGLEELLVELRRAGRSSSI